MSTRKSRKRICSRFFCGKYKQNYCYTDCNKKHDCPDACKNDPKKCGLASP